MITLVVEVVGVVVTVVVVVVLTTSLKVSQSDTLFIFYGNHVFFSAQPGK